MRPGNADANTAADHVEALSRAVEQLPEDRPDEILVRCDSAGATHDFADVVCEMDMCFSVGYDLTKPVRSAILELPESAWTPAVEPGGQSRDGAWVCELPLDLPASGWPQGTRAICRRERPHPGAQLSFTDHDGYRFGAIITNQSQADIAALELRHRHRARVEDQIRNAKSTGLRNPPFADLQMNTVRLELVLIAQDLLAWTQHLLLDSDLARCEPNACATASSTSPPASPTPAAASSCIYPDPGHGDTPYAAPTSACARSPLHSHDRPGTDPASACPNTPMPPHRPSPGPDHHATTAPLAPTSGETSHTTRRNTTHHSPIKDPG